MYGDESDGAEQTKPKAEPPVTCKGLELMKVSKCWKHYEMHSCVQCYTEDHIIVMVLM